MLEVTVGLLLLSVICLWIVVLLHINTAHGESTECSWWIFGCKTVPYKDECKSYVTDTDIIPMVTWVSNGKSSYPITTFIPISHHHYDCVRTFDNGTVNKWSKED